MFFSNQRARMGGDGLNDLKDGRQVHLALYKYDSCPFCMRVFRAVDRLPVQIEYRDILRDPQWRRSLSELTGRTTVPCLFIDNEPLFESADIIGWLNKTFGDRDA